MPCPHFVETRLCRCLAVRGLLVPSLHERELYCRSSEPERCPTYQAFETRGAPLPEEVYYALWLPPRERGEELPATPCIDCTTA